MTVVGPLPGGAVRTFTNTDPGDSGFRYSASTKTWTFNLQTKDAGGKPYPVGTYQATIESDNTRIRVRARRSEIQGLSSSQLSVQ